MPLTEERAISNSYPVEASGWDIAHFFVEKSELDWKAASTSRSPIRAVQGP
jgi:hypothetical protein